MKILINIIIIITLTSCSSNQIPYLIKPDSENATLINVSLRNLKVKTIDGKEVPQNQIYIVSSGEHTMIAQLNPQMYKSRTTKLSFMVETGKKYFIAVNMHEFSRDPSVSRWSYSISDSSGKRVSY